MLPQSMKPELSYLAHNLVEIDKYRVETCCVIGKCKSGLIKSYADKMQMESRRLIKKTPINIQNPELLLLHLHFG